MTVPVRTVPSNGERYAFLKQRHPIYDKMSPIWLRNEDRYEGGHRVEKELWRFDWESLRAEQSSAILRDGVTRKPPIENAPIPDFVAAPMGPGEHYERRQSSAIYVNFMDSFATDVIGSLMRQAPSPADGLNFGRLGNVRRIKEVQGTPSRAELFYYNCDGVGLDGTQWDNFWAKQLKMAMVTGYRWIFVEAPVSPGGIISIRREQSGLRPYLIGYSPLAVTNWQYVNNRLDWSIMEIMTRRPRVEDGELKGNVPVPEFMLMVRAGVRDLGDEFAGGGWFRFDAELNPMPGESGTWAKTGGDIPMVPLFYEKHEESFGRPALTELGNAGVASMNIHSAADFGAFDAAGAVRAIIGATPEAFNTFIRKIREGNQYSPLEFNLETEHSPDIKSVGADTSSFDIFDKRVAAILTAVDRICGSELKNAAPNSGLAQQAGYALSGVPRLVLFSGNAEETQNSVIALSEMRWGFDDPAGSAMWKRDYELIRLTSTAQAILQLMQIAGIHSATLETRVIVSSARDESYITDDPMATTIENELMASASVRDKAAALAVQPKPAPGVPGERATPTPPEPAQTNQDTKTQIDGGNVA